MLLLPLFSWLLITYYVPVLNIGLAKKFVRVFPQDVMEKPERTFLPAQYLLPYLISHQFF